MVSAVYLHVDEVRRLTYLSFPFLFLLTDCYCLLPSSRPSNVQCENRRIFFPSTLHGRKDEAVGRVQNARAKKRERRRTTPRTHAFTSTNYTPAHSFARYFDDSFLSLLGKLCANRENLALVGPFTTNVSSNEARVGCPIPTS